jgi:ring-1,2-phenylacetyl-CoA epoxidase subunit PaaB
MTETIWPLYEVFIRPKNGLSHKHVGSLHAVDGEMALQNARDVYTRRGEAMSVWVVPSAAIIALEPDDRETLLDPSAKDRKPYRHPTFYDIPDDVGHM